MPSGGKKKSPKKVEQNEQSTKEKSLPEVDVVVEMFDRCSRTGVGGLSAEMMEAMLGMDDEQTEKMLRMTRSNFTEEVGGDREMVIGGIKKFVQERKRRREVQREEETGKAKEKQEKEVRTGRGNAGLVQGEDERCRGNEASGKGKGKGREGKGEHGKEGGQGGKGARQKMPSEEDEEDERTVVAPNTGAGGSHLRATTDQEGRKEEGEEAEEQQCRGRKRSQAGEWTLRPAREWQKWADCVDVEPEEEEGESREAGDEEEEVRSRWV